MGQEASTLVDSNTTPQRLSHRSLDGIADYIKDGSAQKIVVLTGAGISTSAGIPDFRSPDTGLYANLAKLNLPYPEAVFDISFFRQNPRPFYALAHELYPGTYQPTITHIFIRLLSKKGLLLKLFTQNIDCLERKAGVPDSLIVEAHGSFAHQRCIECKSSFPEHLMRSAINLQEVPHCLTPQCNGLVKPDIVFFGESLPEAFFLHRELPAVADLCIIMGTSLSVHPFASLPSLCGQGIPRLLINGERVGGIGSRTDDVLHLGDCDTGVRQLADALGWRDELEALWHEMTGGEVPLITEEIPKTKDEQLEDEIARLNIDVAKVLKASSGLDHLVKEAFLRIGDGEKLCCEKLHLDAGAEGIADLGGKQDESIPRQSQTDKGESDSVDTDLSKATARLSI